MFWMFVFAFIIILMSFLCGVLVSDFIDYNKEKHRFYTPLGFVVLLGLLQILYYPIQLYNLPTKYIYILTIGVFFIIVILSIIRYKIVLKHINDYKKVYKELIFGFLIFIVFCSIYYFVKFPTRTDDLYFYIPYTISKFKQPNLTAHLYDQYGFQGFYDFSAMWIWIYEKLVNFNVAPSILPEAIVVWVLSIVMFFILAFCIVDIMVWVRSLYNKYISSWIIGFTLFIYSIGAYWYLQTPYIGNSFRRVSIVVIFSVIISMLDNFNIKKLIILELCFISIISQTSTGFFFAAFILYGLMFYYARKKETGYLKKIVFLSVGPMFFVSLFVVYVMYYVNSLYGLYFTFVILKLDKKIEEILNKFYLPILIAIPLLFGIYTRLPHFKLPTLNISYFDITPNFFDRHAYEGIENLFEFGFANIQEILTSLFCIFCWVVIIFYLIKHVKSNKPNDYIAFNTLIIFITFFNPWVITFVMSYMTNVVYFRIYDLFFNILTIFMFFGFAFEKIKGKNIYLLGVVMFLLFTNEVFKNQTWMFMGFNDEDFNHLYHVDNLEIEVLDRFNKEILNNTNEEVIIASQIYSSEAFTIANIKNVKNNIYTYGNDKSDEAEFQRIFYRYEIGLEEIKGDYIRACELSKQREVKYVILDAQYNRDLENGIGYCGQKVLEVGNYRVFEMHYDWLEWSMGK